MYIYDLMTVWNNETLIIYFFIHYFIFYCKRKNVSTIYSDVFVLP